MKLGKVRLLIEMFPVNYLSVCLGDHPEQRPVLALRLFLLRGLRRGLILPEVRLQQPPGVRALHQGRREDNLREVYPHHRDER